jgi:hypothetical protein
MKWLAGRLDGELRLADHAAREAGGAPVPAAHAASPPPRICAIREGLYERCADGDAGGGGVNVGADGEVAPAPSNDAPLPAFADAFPLAYGAAVPEPTPASPDAAVRRYLFTFPSDNPVKRIDLVLLAAPAGTRLLGNGSGDGSGGGGGGGEGPSVTVGDYFLLGQDGLPGTEAYEGRGLGMTDQRSPIYASDHRAVVVDFLLSAPPQPSATQQERR